MTTPFLSYPIAATGAPTAFAYPDRLSQNINVKDYGAVGDGVTDDTSAIQDALDAAFGPPSSPHGDADRFDHKVVRFPPGNYRITSQIEIRWVMGGTIAGAGSGTTVITYDGAISGSVNTNLFYVDGMKGTRIQGISFVMNANALADKTIAFNYNWVRLSTPNEIGGGWCIFTDCSFSGATTGLKIGENDQCDTTMLVNCRFDDCYYGLWSVNFNALQNGMYGGSVTNCAQHGIYLPSGSMNSIVGVTFSNNGSSDLGTSDIWLASGAPVFIIGCHSDSINFCIAAVGHHYMAGCRHECSTAGRFLRLGAAPPRGAGVVVEGCYSSHGYFHSHSDAKGLYVVDTQLDHPDWTSTAGPIREWVQKTPFTFATKPGGSTSAWWGEGLILNITDSSTATWGATVTGGGSNHVSMRWNGSNWTVVGG